MQFYFKVNDAHLRFITGIGYNPFKHEIVTGSEDGIVKFWELETGALISSCQAHQGWVTSFLFWKSTKFMFSSSHDCTISLWQGNSVVQIIPLEEPIYKLCFDSSEYLLLCGTSNGLHVYTLDKDKTCGFYIDVNLRTEMKEHTGIVRCIVACDNRIYCAGFDKKLTVYDCVYYGSEFLKISTVIQAHEAAITCLCVYKDTENNVWIVTGGFDKVVKIWNNGAKLTHRIDGFNRPILDISVVDRTQQIWVSTGGSLPSIFDNKSGEDVSQFTNTFQSIEGERFKLQLLKYFPEVGMVIASTTRRHLLAWRSQTSSAVTRLMCGMPIDCICLTSKSPLLIFCGVQQGQIVQWEKRESNEASFQMELTKLGKSMETAVDNKLQSRQFQLEPSYSRNRVQQKLDAKRNRTGQRFLQIIYLECKDLLVAAAEDGIIYMFGYDISAIEALLAVTKLKATEPASTTFQTQQLNPDSAETKAFVNPVTMRITGLSCQQVLLEHKNVVSGIAVVEPGHGRTEHFLLSCSWDQTVGVWSLGSFELVTKYQSGQIDDKRTQQSAADDAITSIEYCGTQDQFAYASVDFVVQIRKFSLNGTQMHLVARLNFNESEINVLSWVNDIRSWVTASEDHIISIWSSKPPYNCVQTINAGGPVSSLCYDDVSQILIAAVGKDIKLFDIIEERTVQVNSGHSGDVRNVAVLPGKHQFMSSGEDGQLLIWNSWMRPKKYNAVRFNED